MNVAFCMGVGGCLEVPSEMTCTIAGELCFGLAFRSLREQVHNRVQRLGILVLLWNAGSAVFGGRFGTASTILLGTWCGCFAINLFPRGCVVLCYVEGCTVSFYCKVEILLANGPLEHASTLLWAISDGNVLRRRAGGRLRPRVEGVRPHAVREAVR